MFTDIVESTRLLGVLGDESWNELLRWHDRTLRSCVARAGGAEIKHEGDGFFVAFATGSAAIECAVAIQRTLADHRRDHGFAPRVRIGVHAAEATRYDGDYSGRGVHASARIAAAAQGDEVLVSMSTIGVDSAFGVREQRALQLKGFDEPIDAAVVEWRD